VTDAWDDEDRAIDPELTKRLVNHPGLDLWRRILPPHPRAPAVTGTVDDDGAIAFRQRAEQGHRHVLRLHQGTVNQQDRWP